MGTLAAGVRAAEGQDADLVVFNAKVYTVDSLSPKVEASAVKAGRLTVVGSTTEIKALIGKGTQTFDAKQMTIINKNTTKPPGGTYDRDANGELNGRVTDRARTAFNRADGRAHTV